MRRVVTIAAAALTCLAVPVIAYAAVGKPAASITKRLTTAGYAVTQEYSGGKPGPKAAVSVHIPGTKATATSSGGSVSIYVYASASDAAKAAGTLKALIRQHPKAVRMTRVGTDLYVGAVELPADLPVAAFNKIVKVAEGR